MVSLELGGGREGCLEGGAGGKVSLEGGGGRNR